MYFNPLIELSIEAVADPHLVQGQLSGLRLGVLDALTDSYHKSDGMIFG